MWNSLRFRLATFFIILAIGPLAFAGAILTERTYSAVKDQALTLQEQVSQNISTEVQNYFDEIVSNLNSMGDEIRGFNQPDRAQLLSLMLNAFSTGPYQNVYDELTLLNDQGQEQIRVSRQKIFPVDQLTSHSGKNEFELPKATRATYFGPVRFDQNTGEAFITISVPLYEPRSVKLIGVLVASLHFAAVGDLIAQVPVGNDETIYITDSDGNVVAHQDHSFKLQKQHIKLPVQANIQSGLNGTTVVLGIKKMQFSDQVFYAVAERPESEALALATSTINTLIILLILTLVASGVLSFLAVRQIVVPIETLAATAKRITAGDFTQAPIITRRDEIGTLSSAFNSMTAELHDSISNLENRVSTRTSELEAANASSARRASQFEAIALTASAINSIRKIDELLPAIASAISERFGYYHVGIFLNDENNLFTYLTASNSEGGQRMLGRGHNLKVGEQGIVGHVAGSGVQRITHNVGEDIVYFNNPDLPETKSEMALPLRSGNKVIGVLDVQSTKEDAFSQEDIRVLGILADQVSLAIDNTRLYETTRRSLEEAEALYRQYLRQAWSRLPREQQLTGYRYNQRGATPLDVPVFLGTDEQENEKKDVEEGARLNVPIKLRGETIGNLIVHVAQDRQWNQDQIDLVEAVAERVALSAENARLFDETSRRAERERMVTEITSKIRSTNDPEAMIQTALNELRNALGATQVQLIPQAISASQQNQSEIISSTPQDSAQKAQRGNGAKK